MSSEEDLAEIEAAIAALATEVNSDTLNAENVRVEIEAIQAEVKKKIEGLVQDLEKIRHDRWIKSRKIRDLENRREFVAKSVAEEKRNKQLQEDYYVFKSKLMEIEGNFHWSQLIKKHQLEGGEFIALRKRLVLADVMGLGKTLTAIAALDLIKEITKDATPDKPFITDAQDRFPVTSPAGKRVLYLSSSELSYGVWDEFKKWAPHRNVVFLTGFNKQTRRVMIDHLKNLSDEYVVIFNYEAWRKDLNILPIISNLKFDTIIFDESHKLKEGERNIGYRGTASIMSGTPSPYRIGLTGTPVLNKPQELYPQLALLDPYLFYSEKQFLNEYCVQVKDSTGKMRWTFAPGGIELLYRKVGPIILRRTKKDAGIELPANTIINHQIEIDTELYPHQARAREEMRKWGSIQLDPENSEKGFISAAAQIAVLTRLRQIEVWPAGIKIKDKYNPEQYLLELDVHESQKLDYILSNTVYDNEGNLLPPMGIATEALSDERLVIFSQFVDPLRELHRRFTEYGYRPALFIGDASREWKEKVKHDFDPYYTKPGEHQFDVVLCNYKVGGEGVNLTGASQMIILDEEWNPGKRDQAYFRMERIGQQLPMTTHVIRTEGTVDMWMNELIKFKEGVVGGFEEVFSENQAFNALKAGKI
jgi:SNF2 family DNA or RNA helicase